MGTKINDDANVAVIGSSGAIGAACVRQLAGRVTAGKIYAFSRSLANFNLSNVIEAHIDVEHESSIEVAANSIPIDVKLDWIIVALGVLHDGELKPEKALRDLSVEKFQRLFSINAIGPALVAKYFLPRLHRDGPTLFAAMSARVGSITDNRLGGWYAYRASKAALNMIIRNISIEMRRQNSQSVIVGLHPGTVDSKLSAPFQKNVPAAQLFTADHSATQLLEVMDSLGPEDSGHAYAYDGKLIDP